MERLKLYSWIILIPLIFGLVFGRLVGISLGYGLDKLSSDSGVSKSLLSVERQTNSSNEKDHGYDEFLAANPFRISSQKTASADETPKTVVVPSYSLVELYLGFGTTVYGCTITSTGSVTQFS